MERSDVQASTVGCKSEVIGIVKRQGIFSSCLQIEVAML
jgi:hypothetical protein